MKVLITGSAGFVGKNLVTALQQSKTATPLPFSRSSDPALLDKYLAEADVVVHLAGVNRPKQEQEFRTGNTDFTALLCDKLKSLGRTPRIIFASSIQAELDNPYGASKRKAEEVLTKWAESTGGSIAIFRLKNVFGKWCRPNYNSVVATFCHNIAHDIPIQISSPDRELELVYVDDVVKGLLAAIEPAQGTSSTSSSPAQYRSIEPSYKIKLGDLAAQIEAFRRSRDTLVVPSFADRFVHNLYATYLSYLDGDKFGYNLVQRIDPRGTLAEFIKSPQLGQIFVSRTKPGITRGNHFHHSKTEKFLVMEGDAVIRFRPISPGSEAIASASMATPAPTPNAVNAGVIEYRVSGKDFRVVDIPPGYTHSIENVGSTELVTLFWASEIFDPATPDTYLASVLPTTS